MEYKNLKDKEEDKSYMTKLSQNWLNIIIPFSHEYNKKFSGSELSRITKIPQKSISRHLVKLVSEGILKFEAKGNSNFYFLDISDERAVVILNLIESYKSFLFSKNIPLWKNIKDLTDFGAVILFGSVVKGYSTSSSDIDLVIFSKNTNKLREILRGLPKVQAQIITFKSFETLLFSKDPLAIEILKNHVIFGNVSEFVNLFRRFYNG